MSEIKWNLKTFKISELTDYYKNPRQLTKQQFEQLKKSLDKFGLIDKPIINADEKHTVIGGHQRLRVLRSENQKSVECWYPSRELDEKEVEELNIRLNKNTGDWDFDTLVNNFEVGDLMDWGFTEIDLGLYPEEDMPDDVEPQIDKAEELRVKWGVESGQLWQLGEHRLICGDCTDRAVVERVMGGEVADILFTDPPYGVDVVGNAGNIGGDTKNAKAGIYHKVVGDDKPFSPAHLFSLAETVLLWGANYFCLDLPEVGQWIVWDKNRPEGTTFSDCELVWTNKSGTSIKKYKCTWDGFHKEGESGKRFHPTQKPVKVIEDILTDHNGQFILDPYLGSGTTLIACERLGRKCRAVEISPAYCAVAIQRWVDVTGGEPEVVQ